ncbi:hypothetical protein [Azospirillum sp. sgz301742]
MAVPDALPEAPPSPRIPVTRDDFPYSLRAYATTAGDDESGRPNWSLFLYRATDPAERTWLLENGFTLQGRLWVRVATSDAELVPASGAGVRG